MIGQSLMDLWSGFGVALQPHNLMWSFFGVLVGNLIGVLPGMGALSAISMLLPLTYTMHAVPAILMLAGIFYGSQYGGAIGAILLNLPCHPPHAVTCLDGYPLTKMGKGGTALGITMISSFFAASFGILVMIFASPLLVAVAFKFGPTELFSIMLLGLIAGGTMSRGSPLKGIAMTALGLLIGIVGTDVNSGTERFTFGFLELSDRVELVALALGLFGVADFLHNVNRMKIIGSGMKVRLRDMRPSMAELKQSFMPMVRGTLIGTLFGAMPGTGPTITTFIAYAFEKKISKTPERFGHGAIEGVASPEASSHSKTQVDFIPTMSLGIPGDAVMALILGALLTTTHHGACRLVLGTDRQLLDWQRPARDPERAADWCVGQTASGALSLSVSLGAVLHRSGRIQHEQQPVRGERGAGLWPDWRGADRAGFLRGAYLARLCAWASGRRKLQACAVAVSWRPPGIHGETH
jgi:putative tricarboxylic transport membrane protein